jgi:hypothetical protein
VGVYYLNAQFTDVLGMSQGRMGNKIYLDWDLKVCKPLGIFYHWGLFFLSFSLFIITVTQACVLQYFSPGAH